MNMVYNLTAYTEVNQICNMNVSVFTTTKQAVSVYIFSWIVLVES